MRPQAISKVQTTRRLTAKLSILCLVVLAGMVVPPATRASADLVTDTENQTVGATLLTGTNTIYWSETTVDPTCSTIGTCYLHRFFQAIPDVSICQVDPNACLGSSANGSRQYYKISSGYDRQFEPACGCYGPVTEWTVTMSSEDWYDYPNNGAGNTYVNGSCQQYYANTCNSDSHGAFWDSGMGASTDWDNQVIQENCGDLCPARQKQPWIRTWLYPNGRVTFGSGT